MKDESILRAMAWQRAKGEIRPMYETYNNYETFKEFERECEEFFKKVEDEALQE